MSVPDDDPDSLSLTSYNRYPSQRPFINDDYTPPDHVNPSDSFPENNRLAVLSAMRKLQKKIHRLDQERSAAEANLQSLTATTDRRGAEVRDEMNARSSRQDSLQKHTNELESQLMSAGSRCNALERRLDDMRRLVKDTEERYGATRIPAERDDNVQLRKISELEQEHHKLSATQSVAQEKLRELEEKLNMERARRSLLEKNHGDSAATPKLVDFDVCTLKPPRRLKLAKKKRRDRPVTGLYPRAKPRPGQHYHVKFSDIPFVAGQSTSPSHSVGANVQRVLSMMKSHNNALCSRPAAPSGSPAPAHEDVTDVLHQLQREFHQLTQEHDSLLSRINATHQATPTDMLQTRLEDLIGRMEIKSDQISKLRKYQNTSSENKTPGKRRALAAATTGAHTTVTTSTTKKPSQVQVTTTISTKNSSGITVLPNRKAGSPLNTLKYMKKLQTTLRPNDLSWD